MYNISLEDQLSHKEATPSRIKWDHTDEMSLYTTLRWCGMFSPDQQPSLQNIVIKDICTDKIQQSLVNAKQLGQASLDQFVQDRLVDIDQPNKVKFHDTLTTHKKQTTNFFWFVQRTKESYCQ